MTWIAGDVTLLHPIFFANLTLPKLWVLQLSMRTCSRRPRIVPTTHIICEVDMPDKACKEISGMDTCSFSLSFEINSLPSSNSSTTSVKKACCNLHLWPGTNFLSQLKHNPFSRLACISAHVSLLNPVLGVGLGFVIGVVVGFGKSVGNKPSFCTSCHCLCNFSSCNLVRIVACNKLVGLNSFTSYRISSFRPPI